MATYTLAYIFAFLGAYFLVSVFYPGTLLFFMPNRKRKRGMAIWFLILCVAAAIVFVSITPDSLL